MSKDSKNARLSAKQRAELKALQAMSDSEINYGDIPQAALEAWQGAVVARFYKPIKAAVNAEGRCGRDSLTKDARPSIKHVSMICCGKPC